VTETEETPQGQGQGKRHTFAAESLYIEGPQSYGSDTDDWSGWINFAGIMMILLGGFQAIEGLVALLRPDYYLVGAEGLVVSLSFTGWGWVHLLLGIVILAAGFGVMAGKTWARAVGIVLAGLSALINLVFIAAYPMWAIIVIAVDIAVIFALASNRRGAPRS
jgi:hypothetical protein